MIPQIVSKILSLLINRCYGLCAVLLQFGSDTFGTLEYAEEVSSSEAGELVCIPSAFVQLVNLRTADRGDWN